MNGNISVTNFSYCCIHNRVENHRTHSFVSLTASTSFAICEGSRELYQSVLSGLLHRRNPQIFPHISESSLFRGLLCRKNCSFTSKCRNYSIEYYYLFYAISFQRSFLPCIHTDHWEIRTDRFLDLLLLSSFLPLQCRVLVAAAAYPNVAVPKYC